MSVFSVGSARSLESIRALLAEEIDLWQSRGVQIKVRESLAGNLLLFRCEIPKPYDRASQEALKNLKGSVASALTNIIIEDYERLLVQRLVDANYSYLASDDREAVKSSILLKLDGQGLKDSKFLSVTDKSQRKSRVWAKLAEYLEIEDEIILEGFITFRLKSYLDDLCDLVEKTVEDHLTEREYKEFLKLLRHFMSRQKVKCDTVNVVRRDNHIYILDMKEQPIGGEVGAFLKSPPQGIELGEDDLIVSAVVTLAPRRVVWHGSKESSPCYDLLKDLMEDGFIECPGCPLESAPAKEE